MQRTAHRFLPLVLALAFGAAAFGGERSLPQLADARRKLRAHDVAGALKVLDAVVAADAGDFEALVLQQDIRRRDKSGADLAAQYKAAAAAKPDDAILAYLAARALKPEDAVREFSAQVQRFAGSAWAHEGRAVALDTLGKAKESAAEFEAAIAANPREPSIRVSLAKSLEKSHQWTQAIDVWRQALALRPSDRALELGLGDALRRGGLIDDAVTVFESVQKADPTSAEPHHFIGLARLDAGRHDDALKSFDAAIALEKPYVEPYCGAVRASIGKAAITARAAHRAVNAADLAPAVAYGKRAVEADATNPAAHVALANAEEGLAEIASEHASDALREYDAALALLPAGNPLRVRALSGKAFVLILAGRMEEALGAVDLAVAQDDRDPGPYLLGARALAIKADHEEAIKRYLAPGLKLLPDEPRLKHARGIALWSLGKLNDAKRDLEAAVAADGKEGRFHLSLGELYYQLKMNKQAAAEFATAAEQRPDDPAPWRGLGRARTSLKEWENAAVAFEEVVRMVEGGPAPDPAAPPEAPPAPPAPDKPADPAAPPKDPAPAAAPPAYATAEHLYLALLYADRLNKKDLAKEHAKKWVEQGGSNPNLDSWVQNLLADK